jgi:hypothetical protein
LLLLCSCGSGRGFGDIPQPDAALQQTGTSRDISAELQQLESLPTPEGVDSARFAELKDALRSLLEQYRDGKMLSTAPKSAHSKVMDFELDNGAGGTAELHWTYVNRGDYDQNSEVNVADLTPLGRFLGTNSGSPEWARASVSNGDGNSEVNVADVTPIGQNFLMAVSGYRLLSATTASAGSWTTVAEIPFASGSVADGAVLQSFSYTLASPENKLWYCVAPYNSDGQGEPSAPQQFLAPTPIVNSILPQSGKQGAQVTFNANVTGTVDTYLWDFNGAALPGTSTEASPQVTLAAAGIYACHLTIGNEFGETVRNFQLLVNQNQAPLASLNLSLASGSAPLSVTLDAGSSLDNDGEIVSYEWDFDGDGSYDQSSGPLEPAVQHVYTENGQYAPAVRVTDDSGAVATQSSSLKVGSPLEGNWNLMVWIAADNNLADYGVEDIEELEQFGSDENINILVGYDIDPAWLWEPVPGTDQVHFIKVVQDSTPLSINTAGDPANLSFPRSGFNSASPARVAQFVDWCESNFPAEHSCLVLWDHGNGWRLGGTGERTGSSVAPLPEIFKSTNPVNYRPKPRHRPYGQSTAQPIRDTSGVLSDDSDGPWDITSNQAIVSALAGRHFDMIAFDACNMAHVESLYEYTGLADWLVASELLVPGPGYAYDRLLQHWHDNFPASAQKVGECFVDGVIEEYTGGSWDVNHAVFESAGLVSLVADLGTLAQQVLANAEAESADFQSAMFASFEPDAGDGTRDLKMFLSQYLAKSSNNQIKTELGGLQSAIGQCMTYFRESLSPSSTGVAIYLPSEWYFDASMQNEYAQLPFNKDTQWLEMLQALDLQGGGGGGGIQLDWEAGDRVEISWSGAANDCDLYITEPNGDWSGAWWGNDLFSNNLLASGDSADIGPYEWLKLKNGAQSGPYTVDLWYYESTIGNPVTITVRLYDSANQLKEEIGQVPMLFPGYWEFEYATLTLQ